MQHHDIARTFNHLFGVSAQTVLEGGAVEPFYRPPHYPDPARLQYREDFAASALHEAAHWCIAGPARRAQKDFGYAYLEPPRTAAQQAQFFNAELRAQTLEFIFSQACGLPFQPSADNLNADVHSYGLRVKRFTQTMRNWMQVTPDARARQFCQALTRQSLTVATARASA